MSILDTSEAGLHINAPDINEDDACRWNWLMTAGPCSVITLVNCEFYDIDCHRCAEAHNLSKHCPVCGRLTKSNSYEQVCECGAMLSICAPNGSETLRAVCGVAVPIIKCNEDVM